MEHNPSLLIFSYLVFDETFLHSSWSLYRCDKKFRKRYTAKYIFSKEVRLNLEFLHKISRELYVTYLSNSK